MEDARNVETPWMKSSGRSPPSRVLMGGPARPLMVQNNLGLEHVRCGAVTFGVLYLSFEAQWDFTGDPECRA